MVHTYTMTRCDVANGEISQIVIQQEYTNRLTIYIGMYMLPPRLFRQLSFRADECKN
jgi:hypothetical protein